VRTLVLLFHLIEFESSHRLTNFAPDYVFWDESPSQLPTRAMFQYLPRPEKRLRSYPDLDINLFSAGSLRLARHVWKPLYESRRNSVRLGNAELVVWEMYCASNTKPTSSQSHGSSLYMLLHDTRISQLKTQLASTSYHLVSSI
jgi:hypothetical protein